MTVSPLDSKHKRATDFTTSSLLDEIETEQHQFTHPKRHVEYDTKRLKKKTQHYKISLSKTTCVLILMSEPIPPSSHYISVLCCAIVSIPNTLFFIFT